MQYARILPELSARLLFASSRMWTSAENGFVYQANWPVDLYIVAVKVSGFAIRVHWKKKNSTMMLQAVFFWPEWSS